MTIVAGDVLRTSVNFALADGTLYQNIFHHKRTGVGILSNATHVASLKAWAEGMYGELVDIVKDNVVSGLSSVDLVEWVDTKWEVVENIGTFTADFTPLSATQANPNQISAFVIFKTARPKTVGRKFLFPMTEADQAAGILTPGAVEDIVAWANDAVNNIIIQAFDDLVPGVPRTAADVFLEFTLALVTNLVGTQRRRRPGEGA